MKKMLLILTGFCSFILLAESHSQTHSEMPFSETRRGRFSERRNEPSATALNTAFAFARKGEFEKLYKLFNQDNIAVILEKLPPTSDSEGHGVQSLLALVGEAIKSQEYPDPDLVRLRELLEQQHNKNSTR